MYSMQTYLKMSVIVWLAMPKVEAGGSACGPYRSTGSTGGYSISSSCSSYERAHTVSSGGPIAAQVYYNSLGNNVCLVYKGTDESGPLLGTLTRDGSTSGMVKSNGSSLFISCDMTSGGANSPHIGFYDVNQDASCDKVFGIYDLPTSFTIPSASNGYWLPNLACNYTITYPIKCNFTVTATIPSTVSGGNGHGLYVLSDDPSNPGVKLTSSRTLRLQARHVEIQMLTWRSDSRPSPKFDVSSDCKPFENLRCTNFVALRMGPQEMELLKPTGDDVLYVANEVRTTLDSLPEACKASAQSPIFHFELDECPHRMVRANDSLRYVFKLHKFVQNSQIIRRSTNLAYWVITCVYPESQILNKNIKVGTGSISTKLEGTPLKAKSRIGNFTINFNLFDDENMTFPLAENSAVSVPNYVYAKVYMFGLNNPHVIYSIQLKSCWITNTKSERNSRRYNLVADSCKVVNDFESDDAIVIVRNYQPTYAVFKFRSFVWGNVSYSEQQLYAHCYVNICDNSTRDCAEPNCTKKRKRRYVDSSFSNTVSVGPFRFFSSGICGKDNGGCSDFCSLRNNVERCFCFEGRYLAPDKKTCIEAENLLVVYISVGSILAVIVIVGALLGWFLKRRYNKPQ